MRSHLEFVSTAFPAEPGEEEEINPGIFGKKLAEFLASQLPRHGFPVLSVQSEDWGSQILLENDDFPLWIGCANYLEMENGFLCFIRPSQPSIRRWFKKIDTTDETSRLAEAMQAIFEQSGKVERMRWWTDEEARA